MSVAQLRRRSRQSRRALVAHIDRTVASFLLIRMVALESGLLFYLVSTSLHETVIDGEIVEIGGLNEPK